MNSPKIDGAGVSTRRALCSIVTVIASLALLGLLAAEASAGVNVSELSVGSSTQQAGGHPDLTARFKVEKPGEPEVVSNVFVNMPAGVFGNPGAIFRCRAAVFVINECPPGAQAGYISIVANYEGDPNFVLGTTPIYNMQVLGDEAARLAFVVPILDVPVIMPINVRSDTDYGLQLSINSIAQTVALSSASMTIWGFPGSKDHDPDRFSPGEPGSPPGCPGSTTVSCLEAPYPHAGETRAAVHRQPEHLHGRIVAGLGRRDDVSGSESDSRRGRISAHQWLRKPEVRPAHAGKAHHDRS